MKKKRRGHSHVTLSLTGRVRCFTLGSAGLGLVTGRAEVRPDAGLCVYSHGDVAAWGLGCGD